MNELVVLAQEATPSTGGSGLFLLLMLGAFVVLFILPQRRRKKQVESLQAALTLGDEVQTIGGIMGRVVALDDDSVVIEVEDGRLRFTRRAIASRSGADV
ncbi:MAG: preprotein translocase subunit YajC [Acidimicrobiia bacterium]|nr:preprotein translocase subunit YajC [Acidimicrobiia bacterium]